MFVSKNSRHLNSVLCNMCFVLPACITT